ncbi:MAG TPA: FAD-binding oxidoreductase [Candidatus Babeliales bacterium]|nr:FAD-binding oxidoreductase [Candidatus Babeliales bacterium]
MNYPNLLPYDQVFWYLEKNEVRPLKESIKTDVVIIGGGMAGLSAAQAFAQRGLRVVLLEKNFCGSGATGKSSGFITPDSELPLRTFKEKYGAQEARKLWNFILSGVHIIKENIKKHEIDCDYQEQDTLVVATSDRAFTNEIRREYQTRQELNYESRLYTHDEIGQVITGEHYSGAVRYADTFGIHAYRYCAGMKKVLEKTGVRIYEETPVIDIKDHVVTTFGGKVQAEHIIICTDRFARSLPALKNNLYHVQTNLMISAPLSDTDIQKIFPDKLCMVWDTDLVYHYYRITGENRLLLGGARLIDTYAKKETHNNMSTAALLENYFEKKYPHFPVSFEYMWPGLIGVSKDLFPLAGRDQTMKSVYYIAAATGLPWAAALGAYSADCMLDNNAEFDPYFSPDRSFTLGPLANHLLGTRLTFALSNFLTVGSV